MKVNAFWTLIRHHTQIRRLWLSESIAAFGDYFLNIALMWYVFVRTGSGLALGLVAVVSFVPAVTLGPWLGAIGDRYNRKTLMVISNLSGSVLVAVLSFIVLIGYRAIWPIYGAMLLMSVTSALYNPARAGIIPEIVQPDQLVEVQVLLSTSRQTARVIGSSLGGFVISVAGAAPTMALDFIALILAALILTRIAYQSSVQSDVKPNKSAERTINDAWRWIRTQPTLLVMSLIGMVSNIALGPVNILPAMLIRGSFHASAAALGRFDAAIGVGMIAGGLVIGVVVISRVGLLLSAALAAQGLGILLVAVSPTVNVADIGNLVLGVGLIGANAPSQAMMQTIIPPDMLGRVFALFGAINALAIPITYGGVGAVGDWIGPQRAYGLAATLMVLCAVAGLATPGIRHFTKPSQPNMEAYAGAKEGRTAGNNE
ncbi:MFS transporter [Sulfobacillus harzensis]|uniref:MFS transporter n=1 Tax=Sulfobacillus harzensis TaxID=2729629 RepID=A0A7Y0L8Y8_9FIRM|nr:MFS transporter [Sulfobacillus harzensis]NMP24690.1 MFS transporter [Sulfobacillus harzensis]